MSVSNTATLATPQQTAAFAARLAGELTAPLRLYLSGVLGAGKTTFVRHLLAALGERGRVRSPSYALAYQYQLAARTVHHIDCYRLQGAAVGDDLQEILDSDSLCLLEWPEQAAALPPPDIQLHFTIIGDEQRQLHYQSNSRAGAAILGRLA